MTQEIKTQISGKFSAEDNGMFLLKRKLEQAGITVEFPFGDKIVGIYKNIPVTFVPTKKRSFYDVELAFFAAIRTNLVHIVHNKHEKRLGYIGESASIESAYAVLHRKPIILLYHPKFSNQVPQCVRKLMRQNIDKLFVARLDMLSGNRLAAFVTEAVGNFPVQYDLCDTETEIGVMNAIARLFESYKSL